MSLEDWRRNGFHYASNAAWKCLSPVAKAANLTSKELVLVVFISILLTLINA